MEANRQAGRKTEETQRAADLLQRLEGSVRLNQRGAPRGYDADAMKAELLAALEAVQ